MSDEAIIKVENLGKRYSIRHQRDQRYVALRDVIARGATAPLRALKSKLESRKEKTENGSSSEISNSYFSLSTSTEEFWALRHINFEVKRGEVLGIIGRNGAGKTTLLKILSRITEPTEGRVRIKGRVASLLEVGTGFHPELTGRENIYLNGAILGMSRAEIKAKFDEIVSFAETEKFLDTPVKRYSSGMYVRLAFAVAAHLEPEILVVDEVLAVGDAEFQKKCLGKMQDVSRGGRTVLFVSHNMAAVKTLTTRSLLLRDGRVIWNGATTSAIERYAQAAARPHQHDAAIYQGRGTHTAIHFAKLLNAVGVETTSYDPTHPLVVEVVFETDGSNGLSLEIILLDAYHTKIGLASLHQFEGKILPNRRGLYSCRICLEPLRLASGKYSLDITTSIVNQSWDHYVASALEFEVSSGNPRGLAWDFRQDFGFGSLALLSCTNPIVKMVTSEVKNGCET